MRVNEQTAVDQQDAFDAGRWFGPVVALILLPAQEFKGNDG